MLGPGLLLFLMFVALPVIAVVALSFCSWSLSGWPRFVGLDNYARMLSDPLAATAVNNTFLFVFLGVIPTVVLGLVLALFLNVRTRGIAALRTLYLLPAVVSFVASAIIWRWIYHPTSGLLNHFLSWVGVDGRSWLSDPATALPALVVIGIWLNLPVSILVFLAALQRIPSFILEAAELDGAGAYRRLVHIVWPAVMPMSFVVALVAFVSFANGSFDLVNLMTLGGPAESTTTIVYYMYVTAFNYLDFGYSSALGVLQLLIIFLALALLEGVRRVASERGRRS
jgi:multiple sugar transport system permease protein